MKWSEFMVCLQRSKCFLCAASCPMRLACDRLVRLLRELFRANRIEAIYLDGYKESAIKQFLAHEILRCAMARRWSRQTEVFLVCWPWPTKMGVRSAPQSGSPFVSE